MNLYLLLTYIQINALVNFKNSKKFYVERVLVKTPYLFSSMSAIEEKTNTKPIQTF